MKNIFAALLFLAFFPLNSWAQNKVQLTDFQIEEVNLKERKAKYYSLTLNKGKKEINVRTFAKPKKIVDSYFDDQFLVFVYESEPGIHFLTGAYKNGKEWVMDYFHRQLEFPNGLYAEAVKQVQFLDASTLLLTYQVNEMGAAEKTEVRLLRIAKDQIDTYISTGKASKHNPKGNNPIRPAK